jgi:rubrerythrin
VEVLKDIAGEERVHAGEFLRLLRQLAPDEEKFYAKGAKEVEEEIKKLKLRIPGKNRPTTVSGGRRCLTELGSVPLKRKPLGIKKKKTPLNIE